ncbi:Rho-type GTPase-activating protein 1 OS=Schizosaccharomyces pombe (strain 972 / ATCC 24843) GN=rga1 PE=1 SV=1 [Rhizoctonia solani AG-1 IB]|uniref:Rho-type GTPase-activating protein 1 n=2 Tax=Thanatephorus cucumeris (strain AG1-IB / isolate 7/3/14) TaxID=1108050 RepID=A0A0B7FVD3_THACB|nr:Rho-type GTPase-activating protein 1 OS=Schizosaccharomyces pombe (strain 972 / ATCC 24843) GN=rga1 PE=1 SV=1 [Rhizoctonia solani AG-1 IB]
MRSLSGYPEGPRDTHTRPPSQTFSALTSNGTTRSQAYTPTHTHSYSYSNQFNTNSSSNPNLNSNSNPNFNNSNSNSNSGSSAHSHSHSYLNSNAMSRSPAKQHAGLPDEDVYLPPRRVDPASRPSSPAKQSYYHSRTPPGSPRIPAPSLQPNGNTSPARSPSPGYLAPASGSRPSTPSGSRVMGSARSDDSHTLLSPSAMSGGLAPSSATSHSSGPNFCSACGQPMTAQFVRALGTVFHLECFRCRDCNSVVASKFFPIDGPDGRQHPLCERDYFKRLNLICAKCDMALRGSYITACDKKYHVEHFTCSVCPTLFGPQDSYYEHEGAVFCHWHYSTRFAVKCVGCNSAILKQFVEINRNQRDSAFHPECYLIHKFWNVKVVARPPVLPIYPPESYEPSVPAPTQLTYVAEEEQTTAQSLKAAQVKMEAQVYAIWTNLSAFEESSAACISDMLTQVSAGIYLDAIRMAEKFILHVEVLFAAIDEIEDRFAALSAKGMSHVREARMLCRKTVDLFTLLSHSSSSDPKHSGQGMSQELLALVTGLAHYLKILIRIALTGSLKLERELGDGGVALGRFLERMKALAKSGGDVRARRLSSPPDEPNGNGVVDSIVAYGYRSLAPEVAGESPFTGPAGLLMSSPSDLCIVCGLTVEEDCVRLGTYQRWHTTCIKCAQEECTRTAVAPLPPHLQAPEKKPDDEEGSTKKVSSVRRPPAEVGRFIYEPRDGEPVTVAVIYCTDHGSVPPCRGGFEAVSRLEQYAFLLNVALRRLFLLLKKRGAIGIEELSSTSSSSHHRDSGVVPMKSVHLDRKLSATARLPKRSTIVESPTGKVAQRTDVGAQKSGPQHQGSTIVMGSSAPPSQAGSMHHVPLTNSTPVTLRQPTPRAPNQIQTQQTSPPSQGESPTGVLRPPFARNNTQVRIVDDSLVSPVGEDQYERAESGEGLTLGDIPQLVEAEQRRSLPRQGSRRMLAELGPLEQLIVKHAAVQCLLRTPIRDAIDMDELGELLEPKKNTFWGKLFKGGKDKQGIKKKGIFAVPLELLVEREGVDSMLGASRATVRVPTFVEDIVSAMKQMDMSVEGIFRKNGNIRRMNQVIEAIDRDPTSVEFAQENPVQLAALLKKFLREMPDPLLTYRLYKVWLSVQSVNASDKEKTRMLHLITVLLPKSHRDTLEVLFVFLKWVSLFSHVDEETGSKMDLVNLATVITPSILYSKGRDAAREESFMAIAVVTRLLEDQDQFFSVPDDFLWILGNMDAWSGCLDIPMRDMQRRVENVMSKRRQQPPSNANNQAPQPQQGYIPSGGPRSDSHTTISTRPSDQNLARGRQGSNPLDVRPPPRINGNGNAGRSQSTERSQAPPQPAPPHPGLGHAPVSYPPPTVPSQQTPPSPRMTPREGPQPWRSPSRPPSQVMARPSMDYIQPQPSDRYPPPSQ